jgi:very-short-patch-repair endonuclease
MAIVGKTRIPGYFYNATQDKAEFAKELRRKPTPAERRLWQSLRNYKILGVKFRRQHPIGYFVADFYSHEIKLVIEVDGPVHELVDQKEYDLNRSAEMDRLGIKIIRFTNDEIKWKLNSVLKQIREEVSAKLAR